MYSPHVWVISPNIEIECLILSCEAKIDILGKQKNLESLCLGFFRGPNKLIQIQQVFRRKSALYELEFLSL